MKELSSTADPPLFADSRASNDFERVLAARLSRRSLLKGSLATALAAYNGGPGNAAVWRRWAPDDDDLMTALININESRVYVQTVQAQYDMYKRLYERN